MIVVGNPRSSQPVIVSRPGEAGDDGEDGEGEGAAEEEGVDAGNVCSQSQNAFENDGKGMGKFILTAAELAGTTFPEELMIHPLGIPAAEV